MATLPEPLPWASSVRTKDALRLVGGERWLLGQYLATTISKASFSSKNWRQVVEATDDRRFSRLSVGEAPEWCECVRLLLRATLAGDGAGVLAGEFETQPGRLNQFEG